jgi:hypothetical protein
MACFGFYFFPFLLSANVLVVVGTTVAERVAYLPSLGVCMGLALLFVGGREEEEVCDEDCEGSGDAADDEDGDEAEEKKKNKVDDVINNSENKNESSISSSSSRNNIKISSSSSNNKSKRRLRFGWFSCSVLLVLFGRKCFERNLEWTSAIKLWGSAYAVNPLSAHTCQNFAVSLMADPSGESSGSSSNGETNSKSSVSSSSSSSSDNSRVGSGVGSGDGGESNNNSRLNNLELAAKVLDSVRSFDEVDRVDCDEVAGKCW